MPQVDLEAFVSSVCAGLSDRKITCETLIDDQQTKAYNNTTDYAVTPTDFPPESYCLSKDAQLEWLSDNAVFKRIDSKRANSSNLNSNPNSNPSSQRFLQPKTSIIGLPKPQNTCFNEVKQRRNGNRVDKTRLVIKRVGSRILEPSSPTVSCIGRVRSKRERSRSRHSHSQKSNRVDPIKEKANRVKKSGFMARFRAIFRIGGGCKHVSARETNDIRSRLPPDNVETSSSGGGGGGEAVVPGFSGTTRFASGRRTDLLGGC